MNKERFSTRRLSLLLAVFMLGAACGDSTSVPPPVSTDATLDQTDATADAAGVTNDVGGDAAQTALTDGQILAVLMAVDSGEISQGQLALSQGSDMRVRDFGATMVSMHMASSARVMTLQASLGLTPAESALSRMLTDDATATRMRLATLTGAAFDRAYIDAQVMQHARVLDVIDSALLPNATRGELRMALSNDVRPMVASHLQQARDLQTAIGAP
jgi:putative membrane protein